MTGGRRGPGPTKPGDIGPDERGVDGTELAGVTEELGRYLDLSDADPSPGFSLRVMAAIEAEPAPRRGIAAWLAALSGPARRSIQLSAAAAVLVLAVAGTLVGGQLAGMLRQSQSPAPGASSSAVPSESQQPSPTPSATPFPSISPTPTSRPSVSNEPSGSAESSNGGGSAGESGSATPGATSGEDGGGDGSPSPSPGATATSDH